MIEKSNVRIMSSVIKRFGDRIPSYAYDDIMQSAILKCISKYDPSYGQKFSSSLHKITLWECYKFIRSSKRFCRNTIPLSSLPELSNPITDRQQDIEHVLDCVNLLADTDRDLIHQHYMLGLTFREIGDSMGYSPQAAMQKVHEAIGRLKRICLRD